MIIFLWVTQIINSILSIISAVEFFKYSQPLSGILTIFNVVHSWILLIVLTIAYSTSRNNEQKIEQLERKIRYLYEKFNIEESVEENPIDINIQENHSYATTQEQTSFKDEPTEINSNVSTAKNYSIPVVHKVTDPFKTYNGECPFCGTKFNDGDTECSYCGFDLINDSV